MRWFNTAGPCLPDYHYMIPPLRRLPEAPGLVDRMAYFVVHAPRQTGKTTVIRALGDELTAAGRYAALAFSCEAGRAAGDDYAGAQRWILDQIRRRAETALPPELHPPGWPGQPDPLARGLAQLEEYLDRPGLDRGVLVIFDRHPDSPPLAQRTRFEEATTPSGRAVSVLRG